MMFVFVTTERFSPAFMKSPTKKNLKGMYSISNTVHEYFCIHIITSGQMNTTSVYAMQS